MKTRAVSNTGIVALDRFIQATRDSGYKGTSSAIAELVDNSIQASATRVHVFIEASDDGATVISVLDNGHGMAPQTLRQALRFGGSTRFNDRRGLGRYGMGLPNSSLSQARRVDVYTWRDGGHVITSHLDVDEIASGAVDAIAEPRPAKLPERYTRRVEGAGTLVVWSRCDRLEYRRPSSLIRSVRRAIERTFRHYIWAGIEISINDARVSSFDPLYLNAAARIHGAQPFCEPIHYNVEVIAPNGKPRVGTITVVFSELPVDVWHELSNDEKREMGITKGAGVSIVRAGREIDHGWFFMRDKRKENYDDWWRCEVRFDPILDDLFGITHTKQQIHPSERLYDVIRDDLSAIGKALNARVRAAHLRIKARVQVARSEKTAAERDHLLPALRRRSDKSPGAAEVIKALPRERAKNTTYKIVERESDDASFFYPVQHGKQLVLVLNPAHPFYERLYRPLAEQDHDLARAVRSKLELVLLAAARAEALVSSGRNKKDLVQQRRAWGKAVATFLAG